MQKPKWQQWTAIQAGCTNIKTLHTIGIRINIKYYTQSLKIRILNVFTTSFRQSQ